jgi:maltooligosyltrehalose trehalohydrolase
MRQFRSAATRPLAETLPDPRDWSTFARCKLDHAERARHGEIVALHRDLLRLRRELTAVAQGGGSVDGAVISDRAFVLRWSGTDDRLLVVNLGTELMLTSVPEPLLASPVPAGWTILWSSGDAAYGGAGTPGLETDEGWRIPGQSAVLLAPAPV